MISFQAVLGGEKYKEWSPMLFKRSRKIGGGADEKEKTNPENYRF